MTPPTVPEPLPARQASSPHAPLPVTVDPIPGIINFGSVNLLAGASGVGKTCLIATILTIFRDGGVLFGHQVHTPVKIGYICADRGWASAKYWLEKAGFADVAFYSLADDPDFKTIRLRNKATLIAVLGEAIDKLQLPRGSLLVTDPIALFIGNLNDYHACAVACLEMRRLCRDRGITLIGLCHSSKQKGDSADRYMRLQDRINGSSAQLGYGDTQMYLAAPEETNEKFYTFLWHPHTAPAEYFKLGRNPEGLFIPWVDGEAKEGQKAEEGGVLAAIPEDGSVVSLEFILSLTKIPRRTALRELAKLIGEARVERPVIGQYRRVKPH